MNETMKQVLELEERFPPNVAQYQSTADDVDGRAAMLARNECSLIRPLRDFVHVEILDALPSEVIIIPDAYKDLPVRGKVLAVGAKQLDVKPGDTIHFHFGAVEVHFPSKKFAVVAGKHIQAVLEA